MTSRPTMFQEESFARLARDATLSRSLETAAAAAAAAPVAEKKEQAEVNLWPWRFLMLGITASWGCNVRRWHSNSRCPHCALGTA
eukprot:1016536-Prymnesium_polylepis.1